MVGGVGLGGVSGNFSQTHTCAIEIVHYRRQKSDSMAVPPGTIISDSLARPCGKYEMRDITVPFTPSPLRHTSSQ